VTRNVHAERNVSELTFSAEGSLDTPTAHEAEIGLQCASRTTRTMVSGEPNHLAKIASTTLGQPAVVASTAAPAPSKKRKLDSDESSDAVAGASNGTAKADKAGAHAEGATAAMTKLDKGKAKKRRKEEQRALVSKSELEKILSSDADVTIARQDNPPSFAFDTRGFHGGRFVGIKVRTLLPASPFQA
jgi:hypothetical protein